MNAAQWSHLAIPSNKSSQQYMQMLRVNVGLMRHVYFKGVKHTEDEKEWRGERLM